MIPDFTLVVGVDEKHLRQLSWTWPTWKRHKPSLLEHPMVVFRDYEQVSCEEIERVVDHPNLSIYSWPMGGVEYGGFEQDKWTRSQRYKMLAGFVHIPAMFVRTPYWLKLDTDVVATRQDNWIDPRWFENFPAIISHPWSFTKPPNQIQLLDQWVEENKDKLPSLASYEPLDLVPKPGSDRVGHKRVISWCAFFQTQFSKYCSQAANDTCGQFRLPAPTQDGFVWYVAKRCMFEIVRTSMKTRGWQQWLTAHNIVKYSQLALGIENGVEVPP